METTNSAPTPSKGNSIFKRIKSQKKLLGGALLLVLFVFIIVALIISDNSRLAHPSNTPANTTKASAISKYFGLIKSATASNLVLEEWQMIRQSDPSYQNFCGTGTDCPNGFFMTNLHRTNSFTIDSNVKITTISNTSKNCQLNSNLKPETVTLTTFLANKCNSFGSKAVVNMEITVKDNKVTEISQVYIP